MMSCKDDMRYVKESLLAKLKEHCCNPATDAKELGEVADIVKDMCEAEYYCKVTEAMDKKVEDPYEAMYGYRPFVDQQPYVRDYLGMERHNMSMGDRMGYEPDYGRDMSGNPKGYHINMNVDPQYGKAYREYEQSRRHYTQTGDESDKVEMKKHANEHMRDTITTLRQMWMDADPAMRKQLKTDVQSLLDTMKE